MGLILGLNPCVRPLETMLFQHACCVCVAVYAGCPGTVFVATAEMCRPEAGSACASRAAYLGLQIDVCLPVLLPCCTYELVVHTAQLLLLEMVRS